MRNKDRVGCSYGVIKSNGEPLYNGEKKIGDYNTGWMQTRRIPAIFNGDFEAKIDVVGGGDEYKNSGTKWDYSPFYIEDNMIYLTNIQGNLRHLPPRQLMTSMVLANCLYKNKPNTTYADGSATYNFNKWREYDFTLDMKGRPLIQMLVKPTPMLNIYGEVYGYDDEKHCIFYKDLGNIIAGEKKGLKEKDIFHTYTFTDSGNINETITNVFCKFENGIEIFTYTGRSLNNYYIYTSIINFPDEKTLLENPLYFYEPTFFTMGACRSRGRDAFPSGDEIVICINEIPLVKYEFRTYYRDAEPNSVWAYSNSDDMCDAYTKSFTHKDRLLLFIASYFGVFKKEKEWITKAKNNYDNTPYNLLTDGLKSDKTDDIFTISNTPQNDYSYNSTADKLGDKSSADVGWDTITMIDLIGCKHTLIGSRETDNIYEFELYIKDKTKLNQQEIERIETRISGSILTRYIYRDGELDQKIEREKNKIIAMFVRSFLGNKANGGVSATAGLTGDNPYSEPTGIDTDNTEIIKVKTEITEELKFGENGEARAIKVTATPKQNVTAIAWFGSVENLGAFNMGVFYKMPDGDGVFEVVGNDSIIVYYRKKGINLGEKKVALNSPNNAELEYAYAVNSNKIISGNELEKLVKNLEVRSAEFGDYVFTQENIMEIYVSGATLITRSYPQPKERLEW